MHERAGHTPVVGPGPGGRHQLQEGGGEGTAQAAEQQAQVAPQLRQRGGPGRRIGSVADAGQQGRGPLALVHARSMPDAGARSSAPATRSARAGRSGGGQPLQVV